MWTHLWFKLTSAFALIMLIGVIVTTLLTRQGADAHFAHFMVEHHMVRPEVMVIIHNARAGETLIPNSRSWWKLLPTA